MGGRRDVSAGYELESQKAERQGEAAGREEGKGKLNVPQKELLKGEDLKEGIPEEGLRRRMLAVGGKDVKTAN